MALIFNDNFKNNYQCKKYEDKFGQFTKKRVTAMKLIPKETTLLFGLVYNGKRTLPMLIKGRGKSLYCAVFF